MEELDICVNLKVLQQIEVGQKLISKGQYLNIEFNSVVPIGIRRWWRQDNRQEMLKKIRLVVNSAIRIMDEDMDSSTTLDHDQVIISGENKANISSYLKNSIKGLKNLKETYKECIQTCAQIDVLIDEIQNVQ